MRTGTVNTISNKMKIAASQNVKERDYWLDKLAGFPVKSVFPVDRKEAVSDERRLERVNFRITGELLANLLRLGNKSDHRLHVVLAAGLVILLGKYSANRDIMLGMPIYKQEIEGEFINTVLPLRNTLEPGITFKQLLLQVRQTIYEAAENQNYPMVALVYKLNLPGSQKETGFALFDTAVLLENIHDKRYLNHINYNMLFSFSRKEDALEGTLEYNSSLYERSTVERIAGHFQHLFRSVFSDLDMPAANIDILPGEEKRQILFDFNRTETVYPGDKIIHKLLETQVEKTPDGIAAVYKDRYLGFRALNENANRLAHFLKKKGVGRESIVGILTDPCLELITGIAGILKAGGAYLPIDPGYPGKRISSILRDSGSSLLLTREAVVTAASFTALQDMGAAGVTPVVTAPRPQIKNFDGLPLPDRTLIDYEKYHKYIGIAMAKHTVSLQATRGCPFNCAYCHKIWPKHHVARSAENIFAEIKSCYDAGARRFTFIDDVFNLKKGNVARLMEKIIKSRLDIQLFFPNGLRGDILNKEAIDLMAAAGTVNVDLALESASPRIQKLIDKKLDLETFKENARYFTEKYPYILLEMELMIGFPTETEEEALMTIEFLESLKWVHFPNLNILKIYPNTDMYRLAVENGISPEQIERSTNLAYHELPETLPFSKRFTGQVQMRFMNEYFLSRERLLDVLPLQARTLTEDELIQKYDSYLPMKIGSFGDILKVGRISPQELGRLEFLPPDHRSVPGFRENLAKRSAAPVAKESDALRVLLLDLSLVFSAHSGDMLYDMIEEPLGLSYLLAYLNETLGPKVHGKIAKSRMDFDSYDGLKRLIRDFRPDIIGIRTLSFYKEFFHRTAALLRQWGVTAPIIAGGPYATSDYRFVLNDPRVDLVVMGEGEITFAQLIEEVIKNKKRLPPDEVLKDIPGIAFVEQEDKIMLRGSGREVVFLDNIGETAASYPVGNPGHVNRPEDLLYLISTSGSTGVPKSLMIEHRNLANLLHFQLSDTPVDFRRVLQFASIGFDVSSQEIFSALLAGGELYLMDGETKRDVFRLLELMRRNHINVIYWPPAFFKYVFSEAVHRAGFPGSVEHIITAGEQLVITGPIRRYMKENHVYVHNHYGPAETHVVTTFIIDPGGDIPGLPPIGKPIANTRIYILDENRNVKPVGAVGELYIAGANVGRGYRRREELTAEKFIVLGRHEAAKYTMENEARGFHLTPDTKHLTLYKTGDLARWLPDGNIEFAGRADYQVKIRGFRVELGEIEARLREIDDIAEAVVVDIKDPAGENYLCAYIVSGKEVEIQSIKDRLAAGMPGYMVPSHIIQVQAIPVTPSGKVDRKALPVPEFKKDETYAAPGDEVEEELAHIWSEVLGMEKSIISIDANFFELGGHSLKATILITRIHKAFHVRVTLGEMFEKPTIRGLSELIKKSGGDIFSAIQPEEKKEYYPLSSAQKRIYILQRMNPGNISYNNPSAVVLEGDLDKEKFEGTLVRLIQRHETLRTSFEMISGQAVQVVRSRLEFALKYDKSVAEAEVDKRVMAFIRPFDLAKAPLMRVELLKTGENRYMVMYDLHHIITDGTSMEVFIREFLALYGEKPLPALRVQYKDFAGWQNRLFESGQVREQKEYWLKQLEGELPQLNIPIDYPRPETRDFAGNSVIFGLESDVAAALNEVAGKRGATLFMVLLAIYDVLLFKLSGQEDIIIGTSIAGRRHADLHFIIGMFVNTLVMRNYPVGRKTFAGFLAEVKERTLAAFENQDYPFEELVEKAAVNRDTGRNPLFDIMFVLQNIAVQTGTIPEVRVSGLKTAPYRSKTQSRRSAAKFDMSLVAMETGRSLSFIFEYSTRLFKKETIERFISYFKRICAVVARDAGKKISDIEIIPPGEKHRLLVEFNRTQADYPKDKTIHELFEEQVEATPDGVAVKGAHELHEFKRRKAQAHITYRELNRRANRLAQVLKEKGVQPDTIVGIKMERSVELIVGMLGILKAGGAYLPIDPGYPQERIDYMLKDSSAGGLLKKSEIRISKFETNPNDQNSNDQNEITTSIGLNFEHLDFEFVLDFEIRASNFKSGKTEPSTLAYVIYTSGSTGRPKGVGVEHRSLVNAVNWQVRFYDITGKDHTTQYASPGFDASVLEIFPCLVAGAVLHIVGEETRLEPMKLNRYFEKHRITFSFLPTQLCEQFMELENRSLRVLLAAGDKLRIFIDRNYQLYNNYGPTENTVVAAAFAVDKHYPNIPIGKPVYNNFIFILNPGDLGLQPLGVVGELCIGGDGLARGYLNNPGLTAEKFCLRRPGTLLKKGSWTSQNFLLEKKGTGKKNEDRELHLTLNTKHVTLYRTGDLARWLPEGNIGFIGRKDRQVKIRGFRIEAGEIENRLLAHDLVKSVVVVPGEKAGETYLCAYIIAKESFGLAGLKDFLSQSLPRYMIPSYFVEIDEIPLTPSGKTDRDALPGPVIEAGEAYAAPGDGMEERLVAIWAVVLGLEKEKIGIDDDFFKIGGHSLKAAAVISRIQEEFNIDVPLLEVFRIPTIRQLAQYIRHDEPGRFPVRDGNLVLLKKGSDESRHLFLIHDGSGEVEGYIELCRCLSGDFNCWGVRADRNESLAPRNIGIEEIAAEYTGKIKKLQPSGPYFIAGWSLGGTIAFEMVNRLEQMGEEAAFFALIDSPPPRQANALEDTGEFTLETEKEFLDKYLPAGETGKIMENATDIEDCWERIVAYLEAGNFPVETVRQAVMEYEAHVVPNYRGLGIRDLIRYLNTGRTFRRARAMYTPDREIQPPVHYFAAAQSEAIIEKEYWNDHCCQPVKTYEIPGDHFSILRKPEVFQLAGLFGKAWK